ncbi:PAS domain-containing protein [Pseudomonas sp.]|uniref:PAS domain-containing protein n=1 Tax=Pseudomonas sp. TaxID=306 RepID=UPI0028A5BE34|nr:PAS domain-containing protein [Pseudomonas sp.]
MQRPDFESLFRLSPNAYLLLSPELVIVDANQAYLRATGRSLDELLGRRIDEAFPPDPLQPANTAIAELLASFQRVLGRKTLDTLPLIRYAIEREGAGGMRFEERFWSATHTPILDQAGEVQMILQHTVDVTDLQAMKQALHEATSGAQPQAQREEGVLSRARAMQAEGYQLRQLFEQAPGFICFLRSEEHVFELTNPAYERLVGTRALLGKPVREALPELDRQGFYELLDEVYRSGQPYIGRKSRIHLQRQPGLLEELYVDFIYQPITEADGSVSGIFVQGNDVSEQKKVEDELAGYRQHLEELVAARTAELEKSEAERRQTEEELLQVRKLEAIGQLTGGVAHDFNNVLQVIGGNLQLLRRSLGGDAVNGRRLEAAITGVEKGARLASQLLAFARRQPLMPRALDVGELLLNMNELLQRSLGNRTRIELEVDEQLWPTFADVGNLETVLLNLVINARDAMQSGGVLRLQVRNVTLDQRYADSHGDVLSGDYVQLSVIDEGSGMSPEVLERAFEPFFTTKANRGGSGLGLSMVYGFVKQSGGHITLASEEASGTAVVIYLPRCTDGAAPADGEVQIALPASEAAAVAASAPTVAEAVVEEAPLASGLRILFVEDDFTLRMLTGEVIEELGHRVHACESAEEALQVLQGERFDVLLTDIGLGGMSGLELLRAVAPQHPQLKLVIASGYPVDAQQEGLPSAQVLLKPYDLQQVRELLVALAN